MCRPVANGQIPTLMTNVRPDAEKDTPTRTVRALGDPADSALGESASCVWGGSLYQKSILPPTYASGGTRLARS